MFKVGQEVFSANHGKGVVTRIDEEALKYPVEVTFNNGLVEWYTQGGREFISEAQPSLVKFKDSNMIESYVGQEVWCPILGKGVVVRTAHDVYPIKVRFESGEVESFASEEDLAVRHGNRALFHHPVKIVQDESATKPSIDWSHVKGEYKWLSVDKDGNVYVYANELEHSEKDYWYSQEGIHYEVSGLASYTPGTCDWQDSLVKRPR